MFTLKEIIKSTIRGLAIFTIIPLLLSHWLLSAISTANRSLESHSQLLALFPGATGNYLRVGFYRFTLEKCEFTATICFGTIISKTKTRIGKHVYIGPRCMLGLVTLEDDVLLGPAVQIPSGPLTHGITRLDLPIRLQRGEEKRVVIGTDCWVGSNSVVVASIAPHTVIGAGSIVVHNIPQNVIAVGNPARIVKSRQPEISEHSTNCDP